MSSTSQYLTLGLDRETFGIPIAHVHEILDLRPISALPQAPEFLVGMINVRGRSYPVVDLRIKLGLPCVEATPATRIILLNVPVNGREMGVGFVADRVFEVTDLDDGRLEAPPEVGGCWRSSYIAGIGRKGEAFVVVFDLAGLMASDDLADVSPAPRGLSRAGTVNLVSEHLTDRHFRSIVELIQTEVGIQLPAGKRGMVEGRLRKRVRALDLDGLEAYGRLVFDEGHLEAEFPFLVDCMTTNKTDFFREPAHFAFLRDEAMPRLLGRAGKAGGTPRLKLWSAASSNGAEAYTMAMVLHDMVRRGHKLAFSILGTDISTEMVAAAETAIYPDEMLKAVPPEFRQRYVMQARDPARMEGRIVPELRGLTHFQRLNLMDARYGIDRDVDVIFCRNVLIYFDKRTQKGVIERLGQHLRPGGYLVVGHSESSAGAGAAGLVQISSTVFQR